MQLVKLEVLNFRQFRHEAIDFAAGDDENVTVIHGANGSGKTTLLNAFTWLFYDEVDFDTRPDRLVSEGAMAGASPGDQLTVSVRLEFEHEDADYIAKREVTFEKQSPSDFDGELVDADLSVKYRDRGDWEERQNPGNTLDQIIPERLSGLFFFDGEDIDELAGIDNQERIQEAIQNVMGLTILERSTRHLDTVAERFEDEVEKYASDELSELISDKRSLEDEIEELEREYDDKDRAKDRIEVEISDFEQKLERLDESAALQERRKEYREERDRLESRVEEINSQIKQRISEDGFVPMAMPLIRETAEEIDELREQGRIPTELSNGFVDSLLESGECLCGRPLKPETDHYRQVTALKGDAIGDGVEQSALRIIGHLNRVSDIQSDFFDTIDKLVEERKDAHDEIEKWEEKIDEVSTALQGLDQTTASGQSISELEAERQSKEKEKEALIGELGRIEERIDQRQDRIEDLAEEIEQQQDEREEALLAKRRQKAAKLVQQELKDSFSGLKNKVREWSNREIENTFDDIASKNLSAEITSDFKLKIWQDVGEERVEVDKSTGERQIASLAFIGSLVKIARQRYESDADADYFTGGIYPIVMDSPFGALDKDHRRQVSRVIPTLANQVVVFATDSQWEGPVEEEMSSRVGQQYWLNFDPGESEGEYPRTRIEKESAGVVGN